MTRTLLPTPDEPHPKPAGQVALDEQTLPGFLPGRHARVAGSGPGPLSPGEPPTQDTPPAGHERLTYLPAVTCCYAIVQYDTASARVVRRIVGMFGDADGAETYAQDNGYRLYDVVPATAVIPTLP
jgi:hypothetical protein